MEDHFNVGPCMNLEKLHRNRNHAIPSEYLGPSLTLKNNNTLGTDSLASSTTKTTSLGSHWKKVESLENVNSIQSAATSTPSRPISGSSSTYSGSTRTSTVVPSLYSMNEKICDSDFNCSTSASSETSTTVNTREMMRSLVENTESREEKQCVSLQVQGLTELQATVLLSTKQFSEFQTAQNFELRKVSEENNMIWTKFDELSDSLDETINNAVQLLIEKSEKLHRNVDQVLINLHKKQGIEEFIRNHESAHKSNIEALKIISENEKRAAFLRETVNLGKMGTAPLTVSEEYDARVEHVFNSLVKTINELPLTENERADFNFTIQNIDKDASLQGKIKCEMVIRHLFGKIVKQENNRSTGYSTSFNSNNWKSIDETGSRQSSFKDDHITSSSFALTDPTTNDSNLNDLEEELRSAKIRRAVEGHNHNIECSPWNTASVYSGWSSETDGISNVQSLREQMTLSSYEMNSSCGESTVSSVSASSMPTQVFDVRPQNDSENPHTAYSADDSVIVRHPRTIDKNSICPTSTGTRTRTMSESSAPLNYSNVSFGEMLDEALHTAKDVAETQATNLLEALQNSARKCGVAMSDLMTVSTNSSEKLSDTQPSHHSNDSIAH